MQGSATPIDRTSSPKTVEVSTAGVFEECVAGTDCVRLFRLRWTPSASAGLPARWSFKAGFVGMPSEVADPNIVIELQEP
jgi:hypothetical protein